MTSFFKSTLRSRFTASLVFSAASFILPLLFLEQSLYANPQPLEPSDSQPTESTLLDPAWVNTLNQAQENALHRPHSFFRDGYSLRVLTGKVNGQNKTVILLGESHFKTEAASHKIDELSREFDFIGTEGWKDEKYWGITQKMGKLQDKLTSALNTFLDESSVYAVQDRVKREKAYEIFEKILTDLKVHGHLPEFDKIKNLKLDSLGYKFSVAELKEIYDKVNSSKVNVEPKSQTQIIGLEDHFQPTTKDNLAILMLPLLAGTTLANLCLKKACYLWPEFAILARLRGILSPISKAYIAYLAVDLLSKLIFEDDDWSSRVFILSGSLVSHRNLEMSDEIIQAFKDHPEKKNMLVITGAIHSYGLLRRLEKKYDFHEVTSSDY